MFRMQHDKTKRRGVTNQHKQRALGGFEKYPNLRILYAGMPISQDAATANYKLLTSDGFGN